MAVYEPADKILEEAQTQATIILRHAGTAVLGIRNNNKKLVEQRLVDEKETIIQDAEVSNLSNYVKEKITYDKALEDEIAKKQKEVAVIILSRLSSNIDYAALLNKTLSAHIKEKRNFKVYANLDINIIDGAFSPLLDKSLKHGFKLDFGQKTYDFDVDLFIERYFKENPIRI